MRAPTPSENSGLVDASQANATKPAGGRLVRMAYMKFTMQSPKNVGVNQSNGSTVNSLYFVVNALRQWELASL